MVLVDTNGWFLPLASPLRLESAVDAVLPGARLATASSVIGELERLVQQGVAGAYAALALARRYPCVSTRRRGDEGVLDAAIRRRAVVLTADRALLERLAERGLRTLRPRGVRRLALEGGRRPKTVKNAPSVVRRRGSPRRTR